MTRIVTLVFWAFLALGTVRAPKGSRRVTRNVTCHSDDQKTPCFLMRQQWHDPCNAPLHERRHGAGAEITEITIMSTWTVSTPAALAAALPLARGSYQEAILRGSESLSGSTLRGRAKSYSGRYRASAQSLVARLAAAGISVREERQDHGRRVLVLG
jgi:hypothetical protein